MQKPIVKCHTKKTKTFSYSLFILNKGNNSGKPLEKHCPNCFIVICENQSDLDLIKTICFGLYHSRIFEQDLIGSCIQFIRLNDFKKRLYKAIEFTDLNYNALQKCVIALNSFRKYKKQSQELLAYSEKLIIQNIKSLIK